MLYSFKTARRLKHHLFNGANADEVQTVGDDAIDADVSDHEHSQFQVTLCFGAH